ncbi:multiheme c-type cytochrome [Inmirania thermothiophila]|uniref:Cytochrome c554/c'-like protein n=1 Tax=Inmirania thermothiophila TaxID=1750597 RepID=A0A3N1Y0T8_9GAMM|nr:multiheme c-type cytochrome [Inmirania thermothiophila]ROR32449.1 cytochrome c554/c'-like protein [Inmirania thermothiophila]
MNRIVAVLLLLLAGASAQAAGLDAFLARHWADPLPPQGEPPPGYSPLEARLDPEACAACHRAQWEAWKGSRHARAMGPGVLGQLLTFAPEAAAACRRCHAPLAEQDPAAGPAAERLQRQGLVCAACHVRAHVRYGPPPRRDPDARGPVGSSGPHGGFVATPAFEQSAFCSVCHQFGPDGYALEGKPLENTVEEWRTSDWAAKGVQCQGCHMPEREHLWRGIHDPDTVARAVTVDVDFQEASARRVRATITVRNTGTGHHFPTYVTPKVFLRAVLVDAAGRALGETLQEAVIGREVTPDLSAEVYDTRIPAGEAFAALYDAPRPAGVAALQVWLTVDPDHFYRRFFESLLPQMPDGEPQTLIALALDETRRAPFDVLRRQIPLPPPAAPGGD